MSSLESVLRYRTRILEERQSMLASVIAADETLAAEQRSRNQSREIASADAAARSHSGPIDVAAISARLLYAHQLRGQSEAIAAKRVEVAEQLAIARRAVAKADADVKAIERLLEKRAAEAKARHMRREQIALEEAFASAQMSAPSVRYRDDAATADLTNDRS